MKKFLLTEKQIALALRQAVGAVTQCLDVDYLIARTNLGVTACQHLGEDPGADAAWHMRAENA